MDQLDQQRERIQADLRGLLAGDVRCDRVFRQLYASDGSIHEIVPLGVVRPRTVADVSACVQYAAEKQIPVHARGAGSGVAGESLGPGLVLDFSKYLRRVIRLDAKTVRVQSGVVCERLNSQLRPMGRIFGPDPANNAVTTIGGMVAINAAGSRWLRYGSTRRHVAGLQVVLADGETLEVGREPLVDGMSKDGNPRKRDLVNRLVAVLHQRASLIRKHEAKCPSDRCGYDLSDVLDEGHLDLARLLVGSEGTLALTTEATLTTDPLPRHRGVALLLFDGLEKASRAALQILPLKPAACDLMDRRHLSLARELEVRFDLLIPAETEAVLLIEQEGDEPLEVRDWVHAMVDEIWHQKRLAFGARQAFDLEETELFWRLGRQIQPTSYPVKGPSRPVPVVEDVAVPPEVLPNFLVRMQNVLKHHHVTASLFAHAGQGQLHLQPYLDLADAGDVRRMCRLAEELYKEVLAVGGTISGEHACGLSRTPFVARQVGRLYDVFRQVKQVFDPAGTLNPGKIVGDDPDLLTRHLRPRTIVSEQAAETPSAEAESPQLRDLVELQLNWDATRVAPAAAECTRCGQCRTQSPGLRMCPIFRLSPAEESAPRAKANLIAGVLTGGVELSRLTGEQFKAVADLCVHCHMCRLECPARVDVPRLMREGKGAYVASNGLRPSDWAMTRLDKLSALGSMVRPLANWAIGNRQVRWLLEKTLGIAQGRKLPRLASRSFLRRAARQRLTRPIRHSGRKVAYFVDIYANYFDPQLAAALVAVLQHNGVPVYVPPQQQQAGMPSIACGALDHARRLAQHNVALFAELVRQGYDVVATEPSAALCLVREYPDLVDDPEAILVAEHSSEACSYLWKMHMQGKLQLDFKPIHAALAYHLPCHLKALEVGSPGENLLRLIPGVRLERIEAGCSGMAGTFGLKRVNYRASLRVGWGLISRLRDPGLQAGATECSACKIQMEQGTTKPTVHPIKLLALAYGLMPEAAQLLTTPGEELLVT
ncbi:MAG: anaerobic glycerol-3-phosphate dehydrogenase subunit C [Pirellulales bacterium]|nr:anaerobic glycerol-3-phosphate dehydrogenase subunit C [Pirellulales bacterium]